jgi:indolepyruvate ferredoxin oxidoreductase beta subunit
MVVLGAASPYIEIPYQSLENAIRNLFRKKGEEIVDLNLKAMKAGRDFTGRGELQNN